ncbi:hypothetical protein N8940_00705 [Sphingomonadaceae bacterium]|nr:hypothetical protein [Sphingomonadaceae bacterium]
MKKIVSGLAAAVLMAAPIGATAQTAERAPAPVSSEASELAGGPSAIIIVLLAAAAAIGIAVAVSGGDDDDDVPVSR